LVWALTVSHYKAQPHWYSHGEYNKTEHCHIGKGTEIITQESNATLEQTRRI